MKTSLALVHIGLSCLISSQVETELMSLYHITLPIPSPHDLSPPKGPNASYHYEEYLNIPFTDTNIEESKPNGELQPSSQLQACPD